MNAVVDGLMTNYSKAGKGKIVVFLHGWADSGRTFEQLAQSLKNKYTIVALDMPGFGGSQTPPTAWNTDDFSNFVASFLQKIDVGNVHAFVAHSFGGTVAINGLAKKTLACKKLVLIATAGVRNKNKAKRVVLLAIAKTTKLVFYPLPKHIKQKMRRKAYGKIGSDLVVLGQMEPTFKRIINEDMRASAAKLKLPTLLIYGENDDQTPVEDGRTFNGLIKNSELKVIDAAGHFVHRDESAKVSKLVGEFLS